MTDSLLRSVVHPTDFSPRPDWMLSRTRPVSPSRPRAILTILHIERETEHAVPSTLASFRRLGRMAASHHPLLKFKLTHYPMPGLGPERKLHMPFLLTRPCQ